MKRWFVLLVGLFGLFAPRLVQAQPFEPNEIEVAHNVAALQHARAGDYQAAIAEARLAVEQRGLNVFWLNLGRFQQRARACGDAVESYTNALTAPAVVDPPRNVVREKAQEYLNELVQECPAQLRLTCVPAEMRVTGVRVAVDTAEPARPVACDTLVDLQGGTWTFLGEVGEQSVERRIELRAAKTYEVRLEVEVPVADVSPPQPVAPPAEVRLKPPPPVRRSSASSVAMIAGGSIAGLTGLALDVVPVSAHNGELDGLDFVPLALYLGAVTLVIIGIATW